MDRQINTIASVFAALIVSAGLIGSAGAQDCPRGDLDKAYCDRDGDLGPTGFHPRGQAVEQPAAGQFDPDAPAQGGAQAGVLGTQAGPFGIP